MDKNLQIREILRQEHSILSKLSELLQREKLALTSTDIPELHNIVVAKIDVAEQLGKKEQALFEIIRTDVKSTSDIDLELLLSGIVDHKTLSLMNEVKKLLHICKDLNEINGRIANAGKIATNEMLAILKGQAATGKGLYDNGGKVSAAQSTNSLAKA